MILFGLQDDTLPATEEKTEEKKDEKKEEPKASTEVKPNSFLESID